MFEPVRVLWWGRFRRWIFKSVWCRSDWQAVWQEHSSLKRVQRVQLSSGLDWITCICDCWCVSVLCLGARVGSVDVWTAISLLSASAIRFQSLSSLWLSWCSGGAPWGNVIIPCWPQSAGFTALSVSGDMVVWGPTPNITQQWCS